jgi:hypothetical protein
MEKEKTAFGSDVTRSLTMDSLHCFEAMELGNGWKILTSSDRFQHHAVWYNRENRSLVSFCEGDVVKIESPDESAFSLEVQHQITFSEGFRQ